MECGVVGVDGQYAQNLVEVELNLNLEVVIIPHLLVEEVNVFLRMELQED